MLARNALLFLTAMAGVATCPNNPDLAAKADAYIKAAGIQGSVLLAKRGKVILAKVIRCTIIDNSSAGSS